MTTDPVDISDNRFLELTIGRGLAFTPQERAAGWHYCPEWDWLLVLPVGRCPCGLSHLEVPNE